MRLEQADKDEFHEKLGRICEDLPEKGEIIIRDANAQIGKEHYPPEQVRIKKKKQYTTKQMTTDADQVCQLAGALNMTSLSIKFEKRRRRVVPHRNRSTRKKTMENLRGKTQ